jgi:hypothetical protein
VIAFLSTREAWRAPAIIVMSRDRRSQRPVFIYEACANTAIVRLRGRAPRAERLVDYGPHLGAAMPSPQPSSAARSFSWRIFRLHKVVGVGEAIE